LYEQIILQTNLDQLYPGGPGAGALFKDDERTMLGFMPIGSEEDGNEVEAEGVPQMVPVIYVNNEAEFRALRTKFKDLAERGLLAHTPELFYNDRKYDRGLARARADIKPYASHNDKLGYDWAVKHGGIYVQGFNDQFAPDPNTYKAWVASAAEATEKAVA